ncbi:MAG TPA: ERAP1-like C-terminal domain-containing protein, partial [Vicinamibacterales bacterium]
IYQKAPIVMRHLEMLLGEDTFRDGMREYLKDYAFGNATWTDLIALLDKRTPEDLAAWSTAWVDERGRPTIATEFSVGTGQSAVNTEGPFPVRVGISQKDPYEARGLRWPQPLTVGGVFREKAIVQRIRLDRDRVRVPLEGIPATQPLYVLPNWDGVGYGNFVLDPASRDYLLKNLHALDDELRRGVVTVTLWEEMLDGRIEPKRMLDTLMRAVAVEPNELSVQRMLGYTQQAYWRWIPANERAALAPRLEALLRSGLDTAKTPSLKSAWFNALRDVAVTNETLAWLERVWSKAEDVPGLVLAEPDYITLAQELAVRGVPNAEKILQEQIARTQNPDRKARMIFVRPALSADPQTRGAFFSRLTDPVNRRREAWVLEGIGYIHHPLRAASATQYVKPSLEMLREIQRTGDIFFPKRWMDATLSGHTSPEVARTVRAFLETLPPEYPERLRRIVLSSADDLFRVAK